MSQTILIVEDDLNSKILLEKGLRSKGFAVLSAGDGEEALVHLSRSAVDMIISDIMMPRVDGYELCRRVKESDALKEIPFVFYTATFVGDDEKRLGLSLGAFEYIIKPIELDEMFRFITGVFGGGIEQSQWLGRETPMVSRDVDAKELYSVVLSRKLEKKVAELEEERKNLSASESKFRHLVEDLHRDYFFFQHDLQGVFTYVSPSIKESLGYSESEFMTHYSEYLTDHPINRDIERRTELCARGIEQECYPVQIYHKDGSVHYVEVTEHPVFNDQGEVVAIEGIARDVTVIKELEKQLLQSQKMEAVGTLVGGIAHDFNNMLAGITGNVFLAKEMAGGDRKLLSHLDTVESLSFRASKMISQLLIFSRNNVLAKRDFILNPFIKESVNLSRMGVPAGVQFSVKIDREPLHCNGDSTLLQQVMMNLINNARDAVQGIERPQIDVRLESVNVDALFLKKHDKALGSRSYAHILVVDNGCGIAEEVQHQVFDPFYTSKDVGEGTGLGLSMVYGTVNAHDGIIELESEVGCGTHVHIYLPLVDESSDDQPERKNGRVARGGGELILLADDDKTIRDSSVELLELLGYRTIKASNGREAVEMFTRHHREISMAILDVEMPELSGDKVAIKLHEMNPQLPILFMTGYDRDNALSTLSDSTLTSSISKPFRLQAFSRAVQALLTIRD